MGLDVTPVNGVAGARRPRAFPAMKVRILFIKASYKSKAPPWQTDVRKVKGIRDHISGFQACASASGSPRLSTTGSRSVCRGESHKRTGRLEQMAIGTRSTLRNSFPIGS